MVRVFTTRAPAAALVAGVLLVPAVAVHAGAKTVYCKYSYYGAQYSFCTSGDVAEAKQKCEEQAKERHEEPVVCWCTDDANYIRDRCDSPKKP